MKVAFCVTAVFTPVLAKHSKSFNLIDTLAVGVDRFEGGSVQAFVDA